MFGSAGCSFWGGWMWPLWIESSFCWPANKSITFWSFFSAVPYNFRIHSPKIRLRIQCPDTNTKHCFIDKGKKNRFNAAMGVGQYGTSFAFCLNVIIYCYLHILGARWCRMLGRKLFSWRGRERRHSFWHNSPRKGEKRVPLTSEVRPVFLCRYLSTTSDLSEWLERLAVNAKSQQSWVLSLHPLTQRKLRGGRWSSVEERKRISLKR